MVEGGGKKGEEEGRSPIHRRRHSYRQGTCQTPDPRLASGEGEGKSEAPSGGSGKTLPPDEGTEADKGAGPDEGKGDEEEEADATAPPAQRRYR